MQSSYNEAARSMGLLKDYIDCMKAIREAFSTAFVPLTYLFTTIIAIRESSDPKNIWESEKTRFMDDFHLRHRSFEQ